MQLKAEIFRKSVITLREIQKFLIISETCGSWCSVGNEFNLNMLWLMNAVKAKHNIMKLHFSVLPFNIF